MEQLVGAGRGREPRVGENAPSETKKKQSDVKPRGRRKLTLKSLAALFLGFLTHTHVTHPGAPAEISVCGEKRGGVGDEKKGRSACFFVRKGAEATFFRRGSQHILTATLTTHAKTKRGACCFWCAPGATPCTKEKEIEKRQRGVKRCRVALHAAAQRRRPPAHHRPLTRSIPASPATSITNHSASEKNGKLWGGNLPLRHNTHAHRRHQRSFFRNDTSPGRRAPKPPHFTSKGSCQGSCHTHAYLLLSLSLHRGRPRARPPRVGRLGRAAAEARGAAREVVRVARATHPVPRFPVEGGGAPAAAATRAAAAAARPAGGGGGARARGAVEAALVAARARRKVVAVALGTLPVPRAPAVAAAAAAATA